MCYCSITCIFLAELPAVCWCTVSVHWSLPSSEVSVLSSKKTRRTRTASAHHILTFCVSWRHRPTCARLATKLESGSRCRQLRSCLAVERLGHSGDRRDADQHTEYVQFPNYVSAAVRRRRRLNLHRQTRRDDTFCCVGVNWAWCSIAASRETEIERRMRR